MVASCGWDGRTAKQEGHMSGWLRGSGGCGGIGFNWVAPCVGGGRQESSMVMVESGGGVIRVEREALLVGFNSLPSTMVACRGIVGDG